MIAHVKSLSLKPPAKVGQPGTCTLTLAVDEGERQCPVSPGDLSDDERYQRELGHGYRLEGVDSLGLTARLDGEALERWHGSDYEIQIRGDVREGSGAAHDVEQWLHWTVGGMRLHLFLHHRQAELLAGLSESPEPAEPAEPEPAGGVQS